VKPHALKRLYTFAKIMACNCGQEIPNNPGPAGHWYYVINGAVRRCAVRSDGRRHIVDLMLPRDFVVSDSQNEARIEAIAEETVLASYPGQRVELLAERDAGSRGSCGTSRSSPFPGTISAQAHDFADCGLVDPLAAPACCSRPTATTSRNTSCGTPDRDLAIRVPLSLTEPRPRDAPRHVRFSTAGGD
jgi:hypothetical protein